MAKHIQIEATQQRGNSTAHLVTWVPVDMKVKVGDTLTDGRNAWEVEKVYPLIPEEREGGSPWKRKSQ